MSEVQANESLREDLERSAKDLAIIHNLLSQGLFPGGVCKELDRARDLVASMHEKVMSDLAPLRDARDAEKKAVKKAKSAKVAKVEPNEQA